MQKLPAPRLRKAQIASLLIFILMGHSALASVAWAPEFIDRLGVSFVRLVQFPSSPAQMKLGSLSA